MVFAIWAMKQVPREKFVKEDPYADSPLQIGFGQTISQPFIVAYMTDKLNIKPLPAHCAIEYTIMRKTVRSKAEILFWINCMKSDITKRFYY